MDFTDKTVLVTGGGAGIGLATAQAFLEQGARVALIEIEAQRAGQARELLNKPGTEVLVVQGDATDAGTVRELAAQVEQRFGVLDVLVNNVGDFLRIAKPFEHYADDEIASLYAANLGHVFTVTRAMLPLLRRSGAGSIVTVSSIEAFRGIPYCSVYGAFKAAITGFTQSLALELAPAGIRVNLIAPRDHRNAAGSGVADGRCGTPAPYPALDSAGPLRHAARHCRRHPVPGQRARGLDYRHGAACQWRRAGRGRLVSRPQGHVDQHAGHRRQRHEPLMAAHRGHTTPPRRQA